jgi:hypothetical protein
MNTHSLRGGLIAAVLALAATLARAEPMFNGNEFALQYAEAKPAAKKALADKHAGAFHQFRYLRVTAISRDQPEAGAVTLSTEEPGSGLLVTLVVRQKLSLEIAAALATNDAVAIKGRLTKIGATAADPMRVDPAVIMRKDRAVPKSNNELLKETDTTAH